MSTWIKDFWKRIKKTTGQTDSVCADADGVHQWEKWKTLGVYNLISEAEIMMRSVAPRVEEAEEMLSPMNNSILKSSLTGAFRFLLFLPRNIEVPDTTITSDGEIRFVWGVGDRRAVVIVDGEDEFGYAYYQYDHFIAGEETGVIKNGIPEDLMRYLLSIPHTCNSRGFVTCTSN